MSLLPLNMIRYLIVCRVNASMAWLPLSLSMEFSLVLGTLIADRLPTVQARPWRKAMLPWKEFGGISLLKKKSLTSVPAARWPINSVLLSYPGKKAYGRGEMIMLELKLMGESADHALFLEIVLPALETASSTIDRYWQGPNSLWGRFDIISIYVARGPKWETLVNDGRLDLGYRPTPLQWSEGIPFPSGSGRPIRDLTWVTPFDLRPYNLEGAPEGGEERKARDQAPSLRDILLAFVERMDTLATGKRNRGIRFQDILGPRDKAGLEDAMERCSHIPMLHRTLRSVSKVRPGRWLGTQRFSPIPDAVLPYLTLASLFHVGRDTHFGCGTFILH